MVEKTYYLDDKVPNGAEPGDPEKTEKTEAEKKDEEAENRGNWSGKLDFLFSCLSFAVGLGNIWRFPYLCYANGGGAFLIPYIFMMVLAGIPMVFIENSIGQYGSLGVVSIWKHCAPLFEGTGWCMFLVSLIAGVYYNMIIAWTFFYLFASFAKEVPWSQCESPWASPVCGALNLFDSKNCTNHNGTWDMGNQTCLYVEDVGESAYAILKNLTANMTNALEARRGASDEYYHNYVLDISDGLHNMGAPRWQLVLCLLFSWMVVVVCLAKGIQSQGKVVWFTSLFPYIVLLILLVKGVTLPGSVDGILFYITPQWHRLASAKVWGDAAVQVFFSLSACWGGLITLASYNKFHNNCLRDAVFVAIGDCLTSIFGGFVIFAVIGYMAHVLKEDVGDVVRQGAGLAFVAYPEVVARLPISPLWAILFFLMILSLGVGTQIGLTQTVQTTMLDVFPHIFRRGKLRPLLLLIVICIISFLMGLTCTTRGGMYIVQLMDKFTASYSLLIIGMTECLVLSWVYGIDRYYKDMEHMLGFKLTIFWKIMWKYITPFLIVAILIFTWIDFKQTNYADYWFPPWADVMGWMLAFTSVIPIPLVAIIKVCLHPDKTLTIWQKVKDLCKPSKDWGPARQGDKLARNMLDRAPDGADIPLKTIDDATKGSAENGTNVAPSLYPDLKEETAKA
ncbi:unnamed protein product [Owenia fusiformis]|uniref:Transporter n=1 Tax=Owenia fusiformis TaxID=6347 RepID=A0A8J1TXC1_OWEFU|nr:unnamed protein product [Owenia fusiformis]